MSYVGTSQVLSIKSIYLFIGFASNIEQYDPTLFTISLKETSFVYFFVAIEVVQELVLL